MNDVVEVHTSLEAAEWTAARDSLVAQAKAVTEVTSNAEFDAACAIQTKGTKLVKKLEQARKAVTAPLDDIKKKIMAKEKDLRRDIETELVRIETLANAYATEQARKAEAERAAIEEAERKAAEAAVHAEESDDFGFDAPVAKPYIPEPTVEKAHSSNGYVVEKWEFEVVDPHVVPREFMSVDDGKIRAFLALKKADGYKASQIEIAGIKISAVMQVRSR